MTVNFDPILWHSNLTYKGQPAMLHHVSRWKIIYCKVVVLRHTHTHTHLGPITLPEPLKWSVKQNWGLAVITVVRSTKPGTAVTSGNKQWAIYTDHMRPSATPRLFRLTSTTAPIKNDDWKLQDRTARVPVGEVCRRLDSPLLTLTSRADKI